MPPPEGFAYRVRKDGSVAITHLGAEAALLRGAAAANFLAKAEGSNAQALMARATGNYRRGNGRVAGRHPRNGWLVVS